MKLLYGVQATGNGHITRARVMATALQKAGIEVDYLFSGRPADQLFNMEVFGDYRVLEGLTFSMAAGGQVSPLKTLYMNSLSTFIRDVKSLELDNYDLVVTDFEPITAWAARIQKRRAIGIAHQYAFNHPIPGKKQGRLMKRALNFFAPVETAVGVHWDHFGQPILPPLIEPPRYASSYIPNKILVYWPYETQQQMLEWFSQFSDYQFVVYCAVGRAYQQANVLFKPYSRSGFERDMADCSGVIANSGFGLASECVQYGKKLLSKPFKGQAEQQSNAELMARLGIATVMESYDPQQLTSWLAQENPQPKPYPDVAMTLAEWLCGGADEPVEQLAQSLWREHEQKSVRGEGVIAV